MKSTALQTRHLDAAVKDVRAAIADAHAQRDLAVRKALRVGAMLIALKPMVGHGSFQEFLSTTFTEVKYDTLNDWMNTARNVIAANHEQLSQLGFGNSIDVETSVVSLAGALNGSDDGALSAKEREAKQLLFDFTSGKTIRECLAGVIVDGDETSRITRAHNGRSKGGHNGKDRKDYPTFVGRKLSDIVSHLAHWPTMTGAQQAAIESIYKAHLSKLPLEAVTFLKKLAAEELKNR